MFYMCQYIAEETRTHDSAEFPARISLDLPAALAGVGLGVLLPVTFFVIGLLTRAPAGNPLLSVEGLRRESIVDAVVLGILVLTVTVLGGWRSVVIERRRFRSRTGVVVLSAYALVTAVAFARPVEADRGDYVVALALGVVLVALAEEILYRGVVVTGLRRVAPEWFVWLASSTLFSLAHLSGGEVDVTHLVMTFVLGSAAYLARRVTGTLAAPVLVHALYNAFIGFRHQAEGGVPAVVSIGSTSLLFVAAVVGLVIALGRPRDEASGRPAGLSR